ncbi:methyl-accepting chemotaxis protein [Marinobacter sp. X15-166B]|uniref:methyl-accepting chemotaxis protein n=1 Tax=Marinobacter sp. X15-166B TaxID=1897620 RepID=UPI00085BCD3E|nr:methyl-accepting chemotaxis protein [Marinobacter sp. X15-166B]OEY67130.1 chemotaxis protein [Marinobacter sp. X15-166B]
MSFATFFDNLPIRSKLTAGFTLLLLLTLVVGLIGNRALETYSHRSHIVSQLGLVHTGLTEARVEEKNFVLTGEADHVLVSRTYGDEVLEIIRRLEPLITVSADLNTLENIRTDIERYQTLLSEVEANASQREDALAGLETKSRVLGSSLNAHSSLFFASAMYEDMRRAERRFLVARDASSIDGYFEDAKRLRGTLASAAISAEDKTPITEALEAYTGEFQQVVRLIESSEQLSEDMVATASRVIDLANGLRARQAGAMETDRQHATTLIFGATGVAVFLGVLMAYLITRAITARLNQAVAIATAVASGNLAGDIATDRSDEIGRLMAALASMVGGLRDLVRRIESGATNIAASAEELSVVTSQTSEGIHRQQRETDQVATAMNQMTATVTDIARNAEQAFTVASDAANQATEGEQEVTETVNQVNSLSLEVNQSMAIIQRLQQETTDIGTVLDVIKSVAEQTNLLALNAAIEAARAGDQGRGFAVVADEVRSLAQRTQSSAEEIESLVTSLQNSAGESVAAMESSATLATDTLARATATGASIERIARSVDEISQYNNQIATASEQQTSVAEEINQNVSGIRDVTAHSAVSSDQIARSSAELATLGSELRTLVSRFQL